MGNLVHLALIMDGNGRWASVRGLPRRDGHLEGGKAAEKVIKACLSRGIRYLTLYCFSTENWKRPKEEIDYLMGLFSDYVTKSLPRAVENGISIRHLGRREGLPQNMLDAMDNAIRATAGGEALTLQLAINYGGHDEIERATLAALENGIAPTAENLPRFFDNPDIPSPDFIARSSGEKRLSGFMLYQSSYAELGFYDRLWPDWDESMIDTIINDFTSRSRRFGGLG